MLKTILEKELPTTSFFFYGEDIAKINEMVTKAIQGNLILVTSTSPTPYGEGKTTIAISLNDALNRLGEKSIVALREPSLGPVFGLKGGATGGGCAKIIPEEEINLHFTGDIHAIELANNLLSAIIDNSIYQGNELSLDPNKIMHERCMDLNDRSLRNLYINEVETHFNITTASEMMAIVCLSKDEEDLKKRLGNILVGYTYENQEIFAKDLNCVPALFKLLKQAFKPNIVRTKENNLAIVHGGPFANIAHGTSSVVGTLFALQNFKYVIQEAGFGSDMGALKFYDIVTRLNPEMKPFAIVLNTTVQSLKYNGHGTLEKGIENLRYHIENMKKYNENLIVVLNKHENDSQEEIAYIKNFVNQFSIDFSISTGYLEGSNGTMDLANKIKNLYTQSKPISYSYELEETIEDKIYKFCNQNLGATKIEYTKEALEQLERIKKSKFKTLPICIAKTQYSITDNKNTLGYPKAFTMTVKNIKLFSGAGFITVYFGTILTMPGLGKDANYLHM